MDTQTYPVAGGWQAEDAELFMACYGRSPAEAEERLGEARRRAQDLLAKAQARAKASSLPGA